MPETEYRSVLITGATGYIGGRLIRPLLESGYRVRVAARHPERLAARWGDDVEAIRYDALDEESTRTALAGIDTAYYLVHFLGQSRAYAELDRRAATLFAREAASAGVRRIVFLGGLGQDVGRLSEHLGSRHEVGSILAASGVQTIEFRASVVIGSGSTSYEMVRNLVEKLPVMPTPRWVRMDAQPIAIEDVLAYLVAAVDAGLEGSEVFEIGGSDVVSYEGLLRAYAASRGLKRLVVPLPFLTPRLSGGWLSLFTPAQASVGRQLAESLRHPTVVTNAAARKTFPDIQPMGLSAALERASVNEDTEVAETRWCDSLGACELTHPPQRTKRQGRLIDARTIAVACPPEAAFGPIACIGGETGWYSFDFLWDLRGFLDQLIGGVGSRRGRRD
ncbi:MAG: NAD(P)H-binding protein, partial [Actinomycetota bacterium]|nr:NAD(P)H-binding protein [Actinomycetota bacterium]